MEEGRNLQASQLEATRRSDIMKLDLANHQRQVMSMVEASTERRNRAANFVRNDMYYVDAQEVVEENDENAENGRC
jgi:tRNA splicing endonuclease